MKFLLVLFVYLLVVLLLTASYANRIKDISNYEYPKPEPESSAAYTIAIIGTNDIHGAGFPMDAYDFLNDQDYSFGGLEYMSSQIKAILKDWKGRALLIDAGDLYQGGLEGKLSDGEIITGFLNNLNFDSGAVGNHEFDFGQPFLQRRIDHTKNPILASNIANDNGEDISHIFGNNTAQIKLFNIGKVKIGVIGLATLETPSTTAGDLSNIHFTNYLPAIKSSSVKLRSLGADAVVLLSHVGFKCDYPDRYVLKLRNIEELDISKCSGGVEGEIYDLVNSLEPGLIDAIVGGHKHALNHIGIKDIPFMSTNNLGRYFNIMYLTFDLRNPLAKSIITGRTLIEGPVPVCKVVFSRNSICELFGEGEDQGLTTFYSFHKSVITKDFSLKPLYDKWWEALKPYKTPFAKTTTFLQKYVKGDFVLGNYFTDCLKNKTKSDFAILNAGSFRTIWTPGDIDDYKFMNMFPFGNKVVSTKILGSDLLRLLKDVQGGASQPEYLPVSGMKNFIRNNVVMQIRKIDDSQIIDDQEYKFVSIAFLFKSYGDAFANVKSWWKPTLTVEGFDRDMMKACLKETKILTKETAMEITRIVFDKSNK